MRITVVDPQKLSALFAAKGVDGKCPMCSQFAWDMPEDAHAEAFGVVLPWRHIDGGLYSTGIGCLSLVCRNCGFVRLHDMRHYQDALTVKELAGYE